MTSLQITKLLRSHPVERFDCGNDELNRFLLRFALQNQQANASQTYVSLTDDDIVGFYTLVVGEVTFDDAPERLTRGLARHPIPIMLLARMGVHTDWQGRGIGTGLLKDAMLRTIQAAEIAGIRSISVHAKDEQAASFYRHFDFVESPTDPLHLFMMIKDVKRLIAR